MTDILRAIACDTKYGFSRLRADGGAADNNMLLQFQADLLGIPVERPAILETTAQGVAYLAELATHFWEDTDEIASTLLRGRLSSRRWTARRRRRDMRSGSTQ